MIYLHIANLQISTTQKSPKSFLLYVKIWMRVLCSICVRRNSMYSICGLAEVLSSKSQKIWPANSKSAKCHICGRSANAKKNVSPQICGFALRGTYLRTAHLCLFLWKVPIKYGISCCIRESANKFVKQLPYKLSSKGTVPWDLN